MKFSVSITVLKPLDKIIAAFLDPESLKFSQDGFVKKELISGNLNETGSKSKLIY